MNAPFRGHVTAAGRPKRSYESRRQALAALVKRGQTGDVYECELCLRWHVSTQGVRDLLARDDDPQR